MADFSNYRIEAFGEQGVYDLADRVIPEIATAFNFDLPHKPSVPALKELIRVVGPAKTLQDNIELVQERLGVEKDALQMATNWVDRSGILQPVRRSFTDNSRGLPEHRHVGTTIFNTGVARWSLRRAQVMIDLQNEGFDLGQKIIFAGQRPMGEQEHESVVRLSDVLTDRQKKAGKVTEALFAEHVLLPLLHDAGVDADLAIADSANGDEIFERGIRFNTDMLGGSILAIGNAPAAIQVAGQFREAARKISSGFNDRGIAPTIYMASDSIPLARTEAELKSPATHQNPYTAIGQLIRNAMYLQRTVESYEA